MKSTKREKCHYEVGPLNRREVTLQTILKDVDFIADLAKKN